MLTRKFAGLGAAALTMAGLAVAVMSAASASAATGGFTLCSDGGYKAQVVFPPGTLSTFVQSSGCVSYSRPGSGNEEIQVYDVSTGRLIGSTIYSPSVGETVVTIAGPSFYAYNG